MTEKEYIVIVNKDVDLAAFDAELAAETGAGPIPARSVLVANPRPGSKRMTHWMLTDEEAAELRNDPRVLEVEIPPQHRDDIKIGLNLTQTFDFTKTSDPDNGRANWGLRRVNAETNIYGAGSNPTDQNYEYALDGTGVDIVIQDTGIQADHPELHDSEGVSRLVELDWYAASGLPGTMPADHYTDYHGHGTHCAGISAGKTYGFAKGAAIYAMKVDGLEGPTDPNGGIPVSDCFDTIKEWHNNKPVDPVTGYKRPTVVNMSWGYSGTRFQTNPTGGVYRGIPWNYAGESGFQLWGQYGIVPLLSDGFTQFRNIPVRVASVDVDIEELIDAGVHVCIASGNNYHKIDIPTGADYDNTVDLGGGQEAYHRGSSPYSLRAFMTGNIDSATEDDAGTARDKTAGSSCKGPGVNIWAPGTDIISSASNVTVFGSSTGDYDGTYNLANIGGTSMAAPQVAGVLCLHCQVKPYITTDKLLETITNDAKPVLYSTGLDNDYDAYTVSIMGSPNRMLYSRYGKQPVTTTASITNTSLNAG